MNESMKTDHITGKTCQTGSENMHAILNIQRLG